MRPVTCSCRLPRTPLLLLAVLLVLAGNATPDDRDVWVTIERPKLEAFEAAERGLAVEPEGGATPADLGAREIVAVPFSEERIEALTRFMHECYRGIGPGFIAHPSSVAAVAEAERASAKVPRRDATLANYTIDNGPVVSALIDEVSETHLSSTITSLEGFFTRYHACHSTHHSADWIYSLWEGYAAGRSDVSVEFFNHPGSTTPQPSVILTINAGGEMSLRRPGIVVLGAHQDSYAYPNNCSTSRSPGADDDGSGIAVLSEVIRVALALGYRPHETVQFMAYAAEEVGLRGSDDIAETYAQEGAKVIGVLQLDMTNYKGSVADMYFVTDSTNPAQNTFLGQLVDTYLPSVTRSTDICGYGCSDHASWHSRGYAASFPFESAFNEHNPYIHSANDTLANMGNDVSHTAKFTKLAAAFMAELAKGSLSGPPDATSAGMAGVSLRTESRGAARP